MDFELGGTVAVVTGASRGAGRAIASVLGERHATVYLTARSLTDLEATAAAVERRGGVGIPIRCDHTDERAVEGLFERIRRDHGRLDLLVNNAWGGYERVGADDPGFFDAPFWEQPVWRWEKMFTAGVRAHYLAARVAAPLLIAAYASRPRLIVSTIAWAYGAYLGNVLYDAAKAATARMAFGMAHELRPHGVAAVALAPGHLGVNESPEYLGRAVAALASDPAVLARTGQTLTVGDLAREYGFTDLDGTQPEPFRLEPPITPATA